MRYDEEQVRRIERYETMLDGLAAAVADAKRAMERLESLRPDAEALDAYYSGGDWLRDYGDDEKGLLPPDLKRGVLSQDALWDLLEEYDRLTER